MQKHVTITYGLPDKLKQYPHWVVWKLEQKKDDKPSKIPYNPHLPTTKSSSTDHTTWGTFLEAEDVYNKGDFSGLGYVLSKDDPFLIIDFDHCFTGGKLNKCALVNTKLFDSYTEVSQSGNGLHIIVEGYNPGSDDKGHKNGDIEFYTQGRFFALTGNVWENYSQVKMAPQSLLKPFFQKYFKPVSPKKEAPPNVRKVELSDDQIIELASNAKNSSKFISLWRGSTSGYNSASEADLALTSILGFYTQDPSQLARLLHKSGLSREKTNRPDYLSGTVNKALSGITEKFGERKPFCYHCKKPLHVTKEVCLYCGKKRRF